METVYEGRYVRFSTTSKKDAAVLLGADTLVGDFFTVSLRVEKGRSIAWLTNRFGADTGYLDSEATRMAIMRSRTPFSSAPSSLTSLLLRICQRAERA